jgi:hypothetical protein
VSQLKPYLHTSATSNEIETTARKEADFIHERLSAVADGVFIDALASIDESLASDGLGLNADVAGVAVLTYDGYKESKGDVRTQLSINLLVPPVVDKSGRTTCAGNLDVATSVSHAVPLGLITAKDDQDTIHNNFDEHLTTFFKKYRARPDRPANELLIALNRYVMSLCARAQCNCVRSGFNARLHVVVVIDKAAQGCKKLCPWQCNFEHHKVNVIVSCCDRVLH